MSSVYSYSLMLSNVWIVPIILSLAHFIPPLGRMRITSTMNNTKQDETWLSLDLPEQAIRGRECLHETQVFETAEISLLLKELESEDLMA